jgi:hypothetical protein
VYPGRTRRKIFGKALWNAYPDLDELHQTLVETGCGRVAMESTSIYRIPVWHVLESDFELKLANPYFIRQLPGRKSDAKDAQWIAECLQKELIRGSFVTGDVLQQMRQYTRQHRRLTKSRVRLEQQPDNQLQRCNIRFSNYVSNQGNNVSKRMKSQKALLAIARKILVIIFNVLKTKQPFGPKRNIGEWPKQPYPGFAK